MQTADALLYVAVVEQTAFALMWLVSAKLGVPRRPAMYWMVCSLGPCLSALLLTMRGAWPAPITYFIAYLVYVISFVLMRRGIQSFLRPMRITDVEHAIVVLSVAIALPATSGDYPSSWARFAIGAAIGWSLLRASRESFVGMSERYSRRVARIIAFPLAICGTLYVLKACFILIGPELPLPPLAAKANATEASMLLFIPVSVAVQMVIAIMVAQRVITRLQTLSRRDSLTRLMNRRAFERALRHAIGRARQFDEPLSLLLVDLDHFKRINDEHGHAAGDALLLAVSRTLKTVARDIDRVARFGGEEFCILLPRTGVDGAKRVAGRVCAAIAGTRIDHTSQSLSVTASIGVATLSGREESLQRMIERADRSMYRAKAEGRNRIAVDGSDHGTPSLQVSGCRRRISPPRISQRGRAGSASISQP